MPNLIGLTPDAEQSSMMWQVAPDGVVTGVLILEPEKVINRNMSYRNQLKQII